MRIGLQTWGSDGDIRPFIALAARLKNRGHDVCIIASSVDDTNYKLICERLGIPIKMVPDRMNIDLSSIGKYAGKNRTTYQFRALWMLLREAIIPHLDAMLSAAVELCSQNDIVVNHYAAWWVKIAALKAGVRHVALMPWPGIIPTSEYPPVGMPDIGRMNIVQWKAFSAMADVMYMQPAGWFFFRHGLGRVKHAFPDIFASELLNLIPASPAIWPQPGDWDKKFKICGNLALPEESEAWAPEPTLNEFLKDGDPPVFLSLGSCEEIDASHTRELLVGAAEKSGRRSIVQLKSEHRSRGKREGNIYFIPRVPHARLFPLCSAVVHHGGAGTSHTATAAGVPSVVVPLVDEQRSWAGHLKKSGVSLDCLPYQKATAEGLASMIDKTINSGYLKIRSAELGAIMRKEDGTQIASELVEQFL